MEDAVQSSPPRKRLRAVHACNICRARMIRCDGHDPCASCSASEQNCTYGLNPNHKGKTDLILAGVLRMEAALFDMRSMVSSPSFLGSQMTLPPIDSSLETLSSHQRSSPSSTSNADNLQNAVLDPMHTSATESILQWHHFDVFPSLRQTYISIFHLEQSREPIKLRASTMYLYVNGAEIDRIITSFASSVNFWYPTMSTDMLKAAQTRIADGKAADTTSSCLAYLVMALGCANLTISAAHHRAMGDIYMDTVLKKLCVVQTEVSTAATQCLFFVALYFAFVRRPLQAWQYINMAATQCRLLLSYSPANETSDDQECLRRIFWSCYILESDYLAELSALPQSGIALIESSIPLPAQYNTHANIQEEEQSSLYFLACISMRRLLNRVHHVLYARESGVSLDNGRFPSVVSELNHQLEEWREFLPVSLKFSVDAQETANEYGGFLRQRYLTCRSVIYRPYLTWIITNCMDTMTTPENVLGSCKSCLDACLLHIINLRWFAHTVFVDTWICSLSMTAAMLILLVACRLPVLRQLVGEEVLTAASYLKQLIQEWTEISGQPDSPSIEQSLRLITEIDGFIQQEYQGEEEYDLVQRVRGC
ncbi:C6 zinc finger domain-containing protein [Coniochaeta ligniaria NRRL 30616]|uniref:C6 zinc finger domain-containing protein n=1 Tax=Coniochaeta ligniaria NRRL 30616 TaxID=1408157 RepID=A0A1J7ISC4_9PEZI|nr:C6 zinc finger domain-containing protein [Coniochaeta ligniaria NRRL 30616]